ncbi:MAG: alpha/beta fold hydrolase [Reichenbachiella sp.]
MEIFLAVLFGFAILSILLNLFIFFFQERLIFQGRAIPVSYKYDFKNDYEELFLESEPNSRIHTLHFKVDNPIGVLLYFHGNRGDLRRWGKIGSALTNYNYDVFVMDYRGYGKSIGKRSEGQLYKDSHLLYKYVLDHFDYSKIVVFGRSLGSSLAVDLASNFSIDQLILETPISQINNALYRFRWIVLTGSMSRLKFNTIRKAAKIKCPTLILHGTRDILVPLKFAKELMKNIHSENKKFVLINKGGHNNLNTFEKYHESLKQTLN